MAFSAHRTSYPVVVSTLHWVVALLVLFQLFVNGPGTHGLESADEKAARIVSHATVGTIILVLMGLRLFFKVRLEKPPYGARVKPWQVKVGTAMHHMFYLLLILQPLLGLLQAAAVDYQVALFGVLPVSSFLPALQGMLPAIHAAHGIIPGLLFLLIVAHIIIAVVHAFRKDGVFSRVLFKG